jgi:excinuclease ABC subunit C
MSLEKRLKDVPSLPGIYIMKGKKEKPVYVGKASNLKNRLKSYFQNPSSLDVRKSRMVREIKGFDYVVTKNELEAFILEANYIKRLKPRYNIILRDDKNYPYLKLTMNEQWPRLEVARRVEKDGSLYFGPYVPAGAMWETLRFIRRTFPIRSCRYNLSKPFRPCVLYQMKRCLAPCSEANRKEEDIELYRQTVNEVKLFLEGERKGLYDQLHNAMKKLSDELRFEEAARLRDRITALERVWETQRVVSPELGNMDVISLERQESKASVFILFIRNGMVVGQKGFVLSRTREINDAELLSDVIGQFYIKDMLLPPTVVLPVKGDFRTLEMWLGKRRGGPVKIKYPRVKVEKDVLMMASENARQLLFSHKPGTLSREITILRQRLGLRIQPPRIDAVDVSNISGSEAAGALVAWDNGEFLKDAYRLFKIKTVEGIDDFAMIGEVVRRYFKDLTESGKGLPGLLLIDGGKGQLESALKAIEQFRRSVEVVAIAKARNGLPDRLYLPGKKSPIPLEPSLSAFKLLQRIRDEAHRFVITYHKKLRAKRVIESPLEKVKGVGKKRRLLLLRHFGSVDAIRKASIEEIASVKGMNKTVAERIKESLEEKK